MDYFSIHCMCGVNAVQAQEKALKEFDKLVSALRGARSGVEVAVVEDHKDLVLPVAAFPNNWISFHAPCLYPMMTNGQRKEYRPDIIQKWHRHLQQ